MRVPRLRRLIVPLALLLWVGAVWWRWRTAVPLVPEYVRALVPGENVQFDRITGDRVPSVAPATGAAKRFEVAMAST